MPAIPSEAAAAMARRVAEGKLGAIGLPEAAGGHDPSCSQDPADRGRAIGVLDLQPGYRG